MVGMHVFPWLRTIGGEGSTYSSHMRDAASLSRHQHCCRRSSTALSDVHMDDRDTKGDVYEYMLGKIATAGQNGQFRTPRHIIALMVEMTAPRTDDVICDPASGTCGFLVAAGEYLRERHPEVMTDEKVRRHFHDSMFHGYDFDNTMLRIGSMNVLLHGVERPDVRSRTHSPRSTPATRRRNRSSTPIRRSPVRSTSRTRPKICSRSSRRRRPSSYSSPCSCGSSSPAVGPR